MDERELKQWRERALWPSRPKRSKAEKFFDRLLDSTTTAYKQHGGVDKKDLDSVIALMHTYWELQDQITDEDNSDAQAQVNFINQQNDILDELEVIYNKYYKKANGANNDAQGNNS
jgi:hypothetical protein